MINKKSFASIALSLATGALSLPAMAGSMTIDGNFSDWGIQNNGTVAGWTPNSGITYVVEDQSNANSGYLSPGWGGQAYDAEAMYLSWYTRADGQTYLAIGMITGHDPNTVNGANSYGRGDFAIDFGRDGTWDFGVLTADRTAGLHQGDVVSTSNSNWATGLWSSPGVYDPANSSYVTSVTGGTDVGNANLVISSAFGNMGTLGGNHWFYELEIPVAAFGQYWGANGPTEAFDLQWTMLCANDLITLDPVAYVSEPGSLALVLGALGLGGLVRRRKSRN
ncbi:PEP-CTERM sorting domain-containing protein [Zoogloea dura]|uniref:PEP-CTERM sorting domain-containing protein n=1 Tax=Zoogloea dura TaxID=2728840 RepID=A0A848G4Q3_9RHOO|nr:PEP-CTERM sorting domain-containing protein [Zoogloea dura]NML24661.1 PEP-CTERM sorting domain-containing protein [Zoogloea dura]